MALVAYDNSDSSDYEEDVNESTPVITLQTKNEESTEHIKKSPEVIHNGDDKPEMGPNLFNHLPLPTHKKVSIIEEDDEFLHKKETVSDVKPKSKITVPSLDDFKDVKDTVPNAKPKVLNGKKSGLLSILPQPKNSSISSTSKSLIPHVLTKKPMNTTVKKKAPLPTPSKKSKSETPLTSQFSDESDNDDDIQNDFFSINKPVEVPLAELPLDIEQPSNSKNQNPAPSKPRSIESYFKQDPIQERLEEVHDVEESNMINIQESGQSIGYTAPSQSADIELDEEAILKLCGSRGKRKREDIQIVDVNQQEVLADAREWLLKGLMDDTSKRISASKRRGNEPTSQQKRKHQITYLAHQAKANEIELQNQWANNRMTKRQTQSKYGF